MLQGLNDGFGDHNVHTFVDTFEGDVEVCVVGGEDDRDITGLARCRCCDVGLGVDFCVGWEGVAGEIHVLVDFFDAAFHMFSDAGKFLALSFRFNCVIHVKDIVKIKREFNVFGMELIEQGEEKISCTKAMRNVNMVVAE